MDKGLRRAGRVMGLADNPHAVVCDSGFLYFFLHSKMITLNKNHPRYPKYKPSDIDWIGDVPDGWEVKKLKFSLIRNDG